MTEELVEIMLRKLRSAYPNDAWKIDGVKGDEYFITLCDEFQTVPDETMVKATKIVMETVKHMPSIADIHNAVRMVHGQQRYERNTSTAKQIAYTYHVSKELIDRVKREVFDRQKRHERFIVPIDADFKAFCQGLFPDISDSLIQDNYCTLTKAYDMSRGIGADEYDRRYVIYKDGYIDELVVVPDSILKKQ